MVVASRFLVFSVEKVLRPKNRSTGYLLLSMKLVSIVFLYKKNFPLRIVKHVFPSQLGPASSPSLEIYRRNGSVDEVSYIRLRIIR